MMKGTILVNAYADMPSLTEQASRLKEEFTKAGAKVSVVKNDDYSALCAKRGLLTKDYGDFVVYLDKDKYLARILEKTGIRLFNRAAAIETCDDKMITHVALSGVVPMPETIPAPLCYTNNAVIKPEEADKVISVLGLPVVVKESFGSRGKGVYLARTKEELLALMNVLKGKPVLYQKFVEESAGRDMRIIVIGGKCFAAMERRSDADFRSNIDLGGKGYAVTPPDEYVALAEKAATALGLDYCGVDLLYGKDGPLLAEVNSNAFFREAERVTGRNVARAYVARVLDVISSKNVREGL